MTRALPVRPLHITGQQVVPHDAPVGGPESVLPRLGVYPSGLLPEAEYTAGMAPLDDPAVIDTPIANLAVWGRATGR